MSDRLFPRCTTHVFGNGVLDGVGVVYGSIVGNTVVGTNVGVWVFVEDGITTVWVFVGIGVIVGVPLGVILAVTDGVIIGYGSLVSQDLTKSTIITIKNRTMGMIKWFLFFIPLSSLLGGIHDKTGIGKPSSGHHPFDISL